MSAPTKKRLIKRPASRRVLKERSIPWREVYKEQIDNYSEGGLMLRACRRKVEVTQQELADSLGINQHHISEMETGKRPIGKEMAKRLGQYFKCDYRRFL